MVLWSTPESIEKGEASWLAILETTLAVAAYWGFSWYFNTHIHLLVSSVIAPFLLLRSPKSTELGVKWFLKYWQGGNNITSPCNISFYIVASLVLSFFVFLYVVLYNDTEKVENPSEFDYIFITTASSLIIIVNFINILASMFSISIAVNISNNKITIIRKTYNIIYILWLIYCLILSYYAGSFFSDILRKDGSLIYENFIVLNFFIFSLHTIVNITLANSIAFGICIRSFVTRTYATILCFFDGVPHIADNWRYALIVIDSRHQVELIPDLGKISNTLTLSGLLSSIVAGGYFARGFHRANRNMLIFVALFYRWSLKSTCWLYLPLVYLAWPHKKLLIKDKEWLRWLCESPWEAACRSVAILTVVITTLSTLSLPQLIKIHDNLPHAPILAYLLASDLGKLNEMAPWQWCSLITAVITIIIWFASKRLQIHVEISDCWPDRAARWLRQLVRARTIITAFWLPMVVILVILGFPKFYPDSFPGWINVDLATLPDWLGFIRWIYAPYFPPMTAAH